MVSFARRLRMRLWAEHLGYADSSFAGLADLGDGVGAVSLWDAAAATPPSAASQGWQLKTWEAIWSGVAPGTPSSDAEWEQVRDPMPPAPT